MNNQKTAEGKIPAWVSGINWLDKTFRAGVNDAGDTAVQAVKHPSDIPHILNESYVKPMTEIVSNVPGAAKNLFTPERSFRERSTDLSKVLVGVGAPLVVLSPLTRGLVGPALKRLAFEAGVGAAIHKNEDRKHSKEISENNYPFAREANQQNEELKDQELVHGFGAGAMSSLQSDEAQEWIDQRREEAAKAPVVSNKPSILKILKDHKGWIAGAAAGGLVLGIAKNYMDKIEEAENKKKQQRRLFLQSQYPILHP